MRIAALFLVAALTTACGGSAKKPPAGPAASDVPQEVTCCMSTIDGVDQREVMPVERCPEDQRNTVDACDVGPGDAEPVN